MSTHNEHSTALVPHSASSAALLMDIQSMERLERIADLMSSGKTTVPQHLRGSKGDCFAITLQSMQWGMNPFAVAQKTHLVNGTLGYEAQLVAAVINSSGVVKDRFRFDWFGAWDAIIGKFKEVESKTKKDDNGFFKKYIVPDWKQTDEQGLGVKVWATLKGENEPRVLTLLLTQARTRNSTLWTEDPKQQLAYLAQKRWARLYAPDVILGVYTGDELADPQEKYMGMADVVSAPAGQATPGSDPPAYPADQFEKNLPAWRKAIADGKQTAADVIAKVSTKGVLTQEQIDAIHAPTNVTDVTPKREQAKPNAQAASAPPADGRPAVTFAHVADSLHKADTTDALNDAADLIGEVPDPQQRVELNAIYNERAAALSAK